MKCQKDTRRAFLLGLLNGKHGSQHLQITPMSFRKNALRTTSKGQLVGAPNPSQTLPLDQVVFDCCIDSALTALTAWTSLDTLCNLGSEVLLQSATQEIRVEGLEL